MQIVQFQGGRLRDRADRVVDPFFSAYLHSIADATEQVMQARDRTPENLSPDTATRAGGPR